MANKLLQKVVFDSELFNKDIQAETNTSFCNGLFWDSNLTWYTNEPDLTECFRDTILVGVPCAFLWCIGLPILLWKTIYDNPEHISNTDHMNKFNRPRLKGIYKMTK